MHRLCAYPHALHGPFDFLQGGVEIRLKLAIGLGNVVAHAIAEVLGCELHQARADRLRHQGALALDRPLLSLAALPFGGARGTGRLLLQAIAFDQRGLHELDRLRDAADLVAPILIQDGARDIAVHQVVHPPLQPHHRARERNRCRHRHTHADDARQHRKADHQSLRPGHVAADFGLGVLGILAGQVDELLQPGPDAALQLLHHVRGRNRSRRLFAEQRQRALPPLIDELLRLAGAGNHLRRRLCRFQPRQLSFHHGHVGVEARDRIGAGTVADPLQRGGKLGVGLPERLPDAARGVHLLQRIGRCVIELAGQRLHADRGSLRSG